MTNKKIRIWLILISLGVFNLSSLIMFAQNNTFPTTGNVGIGTVTPTTKFVIREGAEGTSYSSQGLGFNRNVQDGVIFNSSKSAWQFSARDAMFTLEGYNGAFGNPLTVLKNGNIGIGTLTPNARLQFDNTVANRRIVLYEEFNNDHQFYGFGINNNTLRYQIPGTNTNGIYNHIFYAGSSATSSVELMRITGAGNVGIGTTPLTDVQLHVKGTGASTANWRGRVVASGDNSAVVMGEFNSQAWLGAHNPALNAWSDLYIQPQLTGRIGIGTTSINANAKLDVAGQVIVDGLSLSRIGSTRGSIWFSTPFDYNHRLYNNGSNQDGEGTFDGIKWNLQAGLILRTGITTYTEVLRVTQSGSVGIGNSSPNAPLQFANADANRKIVLSEVVANDNQVIGFGVSSNTLRYQVANNTTGAHVFYAGTSSTASNELMRITGAGSIGIGTPSPNSTAILHVKQSGASTTTWKGRIVAGGDNIGLSFGEFNSVARIDAYDPTLASSKDIVMQSSGGMVGIGVIPVAVSGVNIKLQVNGDVKVSGFVRTNDLCVSPGGSCDFVFNDDYNLKTLQDLKAFIKKNKHLPHIQSEKEIVSNGTSFNTMVFGQLRTMEELVLYTIQQQEAIEKQDAKIAEMEKTIAKLVESKK